MKLIQFDQQCPECDGTGLYVGFAERNGSAVVCSGCNGAGNRETRIEYEEAGPRKQRLGVLRVLHTNPGIKVSTSNGNSLEEFGGITYEEWLKGTPFPEGSEMREFTCPAWWYQNADPNKMPGWDECTLMGSFCQCAQFPKKAKCWERFDREQFNRERLAMRF